MRFNISFLNKEFYLTWLLLSLGSYCCFGLSLYLSTPSALSSSIVPLLFWPLEKRVSAVKLPIIFCGTFIGMGSNIWIVLIAPFIAALTSILLKDYFNGLGGKLGAIAFVSSILSFLIIEGAMWIF